MRLADYFQKVIIIALVLVAGCNGKEHVETDPEVPANEKPKPVAVTVPMLNKDSAFAYVQQQVAFGPRIPGTKAHAACAAWLESKLKEFKAEVVVQKGVVTTFDNRKYELKNIIASYNPGMTQRVLLCTHWDTRPFADRDEGTNKNKTFEGANDGGSGTGVLLEIARQFSMKQPGVGVDLIFFDLEDYGQPDESTFPQMKDSWCLGSQYWAKNLHKPGYYARYGILLDMVGAKGAVFPKEGTSVYFAPAIVDRVWNTAAKLGYGSFFINSQSSAVTDDHLYVNQIANIPCINIIHYNAMESDFFDHHHRISDNMEQIDRDVLGMVGQTVLQVVYEEAASVQ